MHAHQCFEGIDDVVLGTCGDLPVLSSLWAFLSV